MPHYCDGTEAKPGDTARGKPYNTPHEVEGIVVRITPGADTCNLVIAFPKVASADINALQPLSGYAFRAYGETVGWAHLAYDYGEAGAFRLVRRE